MVIVVSGDTRRHQAVAVVSVKFVALYVGLIASPGPRPIGLTAENAPVREAYDTTWKLSPTFGT